MDAAPHEIRTVVHLDEGGSDKHAAVLRNVANLLDDLGEDVTVELVCHGPGVGACLAESPHVRELESLIARGVVVCACENTLRGHDIDPSRLTAGVVTVPAGIGELVRRQHEGWAYVRP